MMRTLTRRGALAGLTGAGAALSGCSASRSQTLRVTFSPLSMRTVFERMGKAFEIAHPGWAVEYDGSRGFEDLSQKTLREAIVDDLPDVSHQGISNVRLLHDRELARPLGPYMAADREWPTIGYIPALVGFDQYGGETAGLPFTVSVPGVYFNLALVEKAGADPANLPSDWPGILALASKVKARCGPDVLSCHFDYSTSNAWTFQSLILSAGGRMATADERAPDFGGAEGQLALDLLGGFHEAGQIDISREQATQAFAAGALAIFVTTCSSLVTLRAQAGKRFGIALRPFPLLAPDGRIPAGGSALVITTRDPGKLDAAWAYIRFALGADAQSGFARATGYIPTNRIAIESRDHLAPLYAHDENSAVPIRQISRLAPWYSFPGPNAIRITDGIKRHIQEVLAGRAAPRTALSVMLQETEALMRGGSAAAR